MPRTVAGNILHNLFPLKTEGSLCAMPEHHSAKTSPGKWKDLAPYASSTLFASSASLILLGKKHYIKCCRPCHPTEEVYVSPCLQLRVESAPCLALPCLERGVNGPRPLARLQQLHMTHWEMCISVVENGGVAEKTSAVFFFALRQHRGILQRSKTDHIRVSRGWWTFRCGRKTMTTVYNST